MEDLNSRMENAISIIRFRPNIVLQGGKSFDEDNWAEITIGEAGKFWLLTRSPRYVHKIASHFKVSDPKRRYRNRNQR